jgi:AcrR family transcriptional regulator
VGLGERRGGQEGRGSKVRRRLDVDERRAQLVAVALELFSARAYDEVSIDQIAAAAGISKGLLYHYFATKREVYAAALRHAAAELLRQTEPDATLPPLERLHHALDVYLRYAERHAAAYGAVLRGGIGSDPEIAQIVEGVRARCLERIVEGMGMGEPSPLVRTALRGWMGFVEAASLDWIERGGLERAELLDLAAELLAVAARHALERSLSGKALPP